MKAKINKDACIGCGACAAICPDVFEIGDDGLANAKVTEVPENSKDEVIDAKESCPTGAVVTEE